MNLSNGIKNEPSLVTLSTIYFKFDKSSINSIFFSFILNLKYDLSKPFGNHFVSIVPNKMFSVIGEGR